MIELENIISLILNCSRLDLYLKDNILKEDQVDHLGSILIRRLKGQPLQYIFGYTEFMGLKFKVKKEVFIPRPETELLVEKALDILAQKTLAKKFNILDIGTGSGNIAISLAKFLPESRIIGIDISKEAIKIAKENAKLNKVEERTKFFKSDLFKEVKFSEFDLIISNPPYIGSDEITRLSIEVRNEPRIALDAGRDGLGFFHRIIKESPTYLKKKGILMMEMGFNQSDLVKDMFNESTKFEIIELVKDYNKIDRIIIAKLIN